MQSPAEPHWLADIGQFDGAWLTPGVRLLAAVALVWLCFLGSGAGVRGSVTPAGRFLSSLR